MNGKSGATEAATVDGAGVDAAARNRVAERARALARWLDGAMRVPGTRIELGWDALIGLVPVVGDVVGLALAGYVIRLAGQAGAPATLRWRMAGRVGLDFLFGLIPVVGDVADVFSRPNLRNLRQLEQWIAGQQAARPRPANRLTKLAALLVVLLLAFWAWTLWQQGRVNPVATGPLSGNDREHTGQH